MLNKRERDLLLDNPDLFLLKYFPHRLSALPDEPPQLKDFHLRLIETATKESRGLILYPAGHGKTTTVSTLLPIWGVCKDPNTRISVILKNDTDAQNVGQAIQAELLGNKQLIEDFGPFQPEQGSGKPWGVGKMSVQKRTRMGKEPTIALFGAGSRNALGHRTDWTICDDIVHDQNSSTPEQQDKLREWFNQGPATSGEYMDSRLTVVGTRFHPADLYQDLIDLGSYKVQHEDAVVDELEELTLWPERWPWLRLMERKLEMGTIDFNKRYRNIPVDRSRMAFREEWIRGGSLGGVRYSGCLDKNYRVGEYEQDWWRYAAFDPAIGLTRSRKFCAHVMIAAGSCKDHERCFWVVDVERDQMTLPQQVDLIIRKHLDNDLFRTVVEANSYQAGLHQAIVAKMDEQGMALRIDPHYTTRVNKPDPEMGVLSMARWFENGMVHIPWGDSYSQRKMSQLVDELVQYPGKYTDTVLAFWMAWRAAQEQGARYESTNYLRKAAPRWEKRTNRRRVMNPYYVKQN